MFTIGTLSDTSFEFKEVTWNVDKHYIIPNTVNNVLASSSFSFAHATWVLHIAPYGLSSINDSEGSISLGIQRLDSEISEHNVFFKFHFITRRVREFEPYQASFNFNKDCKSAYITYMDKDRYFWNEKILIKGDVLTVVCQMRTPVTEEIESFSQTKLPRPILGDGKSQLPAANSFKKTLLDLKELFLKQEDCDVVLKVKGREFSAHRTILGARSSVFASTFRNDMKEKATGVVDIEDCDPSSFSDFLCFLYCGNIEDISTTNVFSLFVAADKYDVQDLRSECLKFMKNNLSVDTFCDTITLAIRHSEKTLVGLATDFFAKSLKEIITTVKWQTFLIENTILGNEIMIKALSIKK